MFTLSLVSPLPLINFFFFTAQKQENDNVTDKCYINYVTSSFVLLTQNFTHIDRLQSIVNVLICRTRAVCCVPSSRFRITNGDQLL
jgi:hypothetical protein